MTSTRVSTVHLPGAVIGGVAVGSLVHSGTIWTLAAFVIASVFTRARWSAVLAGTCVLVGAVVGHYAIALPAHHVQGSTSAQVIWTLAALAAGPAAGAAAYYWRHGSPAHRALAASALCGAAVGEGWYQLGRTASTTGLVQVLVAPLLAAVAIAMAGVRPLGAARAVLAGAAVALGVFVVYADPLMV